MTEIATRPSALAPLFDPAGVAVVGASSEPTKLGGVMAAALGAFSRPVALVNSRSSGDDGMQPTLEAAAKAAEGNLDLAVICVPAAACADVVREAADVGIRAALICAGGFAEAGGEGLEHQRRLADAARQTGVRVLGPNTSGFFVPGLGLRASFVPGVATLQPGAVGVVAASGGVNHALAFALQRVGSGLSLGVGIGAGFDITSTDVVEHLADDPATRAIALHVETVADGDALLAAVRHATRTTPVVALVVGQNDVGDFARSHTGALATSWRTTRALLAQAGAVVVDDEDALVTAVTTLSRTRLEPQADPGVALVTGQAGPGLLVADALQGAGVSMPVLSDRTQARLGELLPPITFQSNPVDTGRPGPRHVEVVEAVAADDGIDLMAVYGLTEPVVDLPATVARARTGSVRTVVGLDGPHDEVAVGRLTADELGVPLVVGATSLARAVGALVDDSRARHRADDTFVPVTDVDLPDGPWDEAVSKDLLGRLGVPTPPREVCADRRAAHDALDRLTAPVAVKICDAAILHKSDVGGVHLGVRTHDDLDAALDALAALTGGPYLVEEMAPAGVDLVVGARRDPVFGPVVLVGLGGTATEVLADVAIASVPATSRQLVALPDDLRTRALLDGHRGGPIVDRHQLARVLAALGGLLLEHDDLAEVEINPLRATHDGLLALDAVLVARCDADRED
ncbi:acetate--CoA ligase family protein [Solicola sp. PLA-1-18]|uniref:acetate--CoA ligase family protein n=1 Tax=Solicola sp. PLA-1-18 TaxID=3380532 RepID=UPI003B814EDE